MTDNPRNYWMKQLVEVALEARENAYAPYSGFKVGAALMCKDGTVYKGCNVENAAYSPTNCAERTAFFSAVAGGRTEFEAIAIVGGRESADEYCPPCGVCRQVMAEFCHNNFLIILGKADGTYKTYSLSALLPDRFGPSHL